MSRWVEFGSAKNGDDYVMWLRYVDNLYYICFVSFDGIFVFGKFICLHFAIQTLKCQIIWEQTNEKLQKMKRMKNIFRVSCHNYVWCRMYKPSLLSKFLLHSNKSVRDENSVVRYPRYLYTYHRYLRDDTSITEVTIYRGIS